MRTDPNQANDIANYRALVLYDFDAMTRMDWETERRRLADLHARMEEAELEELAAHGETLRKRCCGRRYPAGIRLFRIV